jgi:hypothetical protein
MIGERSWSGVSWAGLAAGSIAWSISTGLNYIFGTVHCELFFTLRAITVLAMLGLCLGGVALSWPAWRSTPGASSVSDKQPRELVAGVSALGGIIFGLAIAAQGLALFFFGCAP